jgi:hypothetical protein
MRKLQVLGLAAIAVFALSIVVVSPANAKEWLVDGKAITEAEGELPVDSEGEVLLEDMKLGIGVLCKVTDTGDVGPGKFDKVLTVTFTGCVADPGCTFEETDKVAPLNLPWLTEIELMSEGLILDKIEGIGAEAGYLVECAVPLFGLADDTCTTNKGTVDIENLPLEKPKDVDVLFNENEPVESEFANCTLGGKLTGLVVGEQLVLMSGAEAGLDLEIS